MLGQRESFCLCDNQDSVSLLETEKVYEGHQPVIHGSPVPQLGKATELRLEGIQGRVPGVMVIK